jgi:hypothetical protein
MKKVIITNKQVLRAGLYTRFLIRMFETWKSVPGNSKKDYLTFQQFTQSLCRSFSITKQEAFDILRLFHELSLVELIKFGKIKLNYEVVESDE